MKRRAQFALVLCFAGCAHWPSASAAQSKKHPTTKQTEHLSTAQILLRDAEKALDQKDYSTAADLYAKFITDHPEEAFAHFQLAYAFTALHRNTEAQAEYRKAIELDPKMGAAYLNLGLLLIPADPAGAAPLLLKAIELLPPDAEHHYLAGTALERSGNSMAATEQYRKAIGLDASKWGYHIALARVLLATRQMSDAEKEFRAALAIRPGDGPARLGMAQCLIEQKKLPQATEALRAYLETAPADKETRLQLASLYADQSRYDDALIELDQLGAEADAPPAADQLRVEVLLRNKKYDEAIEPLRRLLAHAPNDAVLHGRLGRLLLQKRDFPAAQQELVAALRLDPKLTDALRDLSSTYYLAENYSAALAAMDDLDKREQPGAGQWFVRALCYDKLRRQPEALEAYQKFLELNNGKASDQEFQARQRVRILKKMLKK